MATATYIPIATQTLGSAAASITFSSIPGTYTDLRLVLTGTVAVSTALAFTLNGSTTGYSEININGSGGSVASSATTSQAAITLTASIINASTTIPSQIEIDFFSYAGATNKTLLFKHSLETNTATSMVLLGCGMWANTAAITSITLTPLGQNWNTGTIATLWGI